MQKSKISLWLENVFIVVAHLVLLRWIFFVLYKTGRYTTSKILFHFTCLAVYGSVLIALTAYLVRRRTRVSSK